ncbi:MAG: thiamine-phosphate kinase, partial [Nitrospirota bacterium]
PLSKELKKAELKKGPLEYALSGGEDYELLFTVKKKNVKNIYDAISRNRLSATMIGEITERGLLLVDREGMQRPLLPTGFNHFK